MKDVRVDQTGELRCWNCGGKNFHAKRTGRAHIVGYITVGVGALATKKKLKCQQCGEYNQVGGAEPYNGPADKKFRAQYERELAAAATSPPPPASSQQLPPTPSVADELAKLAELRAAGVLTEEEFQTGKAKMLEA